MENSNVTVLLIHPEISRTKYNFVGVIENECLELEYISTILKERGYTVYLYDGQVEEESVAMKVAQYSPDLVYVCGRTRQENFMLEYCQEAKKYNQNIVTVIGGLHAQLCYERMYKDYVDYILTTFDVFKILDIIDYSILNKKTDLNSLEGICYRKGNTWCKNDGTYFDINKLPLPDRTYFYDHPDNYRYLELEHAAWVRTAYCCSHTCNFCHRNRMNLGKYICRDIKEVVKEIEEIHAEHIYIVDDNFLVNIHRLNEFVNEIKRRKITKKYICYGRSDFIAENVDLMKRLKEVGLYYVLVGLETVNDNQLLDYNKKSTVDYNIRTIELCNRLGLQIMGMFIVNLDFTSKDFSGLYQWIKKHHLKHVAISIFTPEMGMETYDQYRDRLITHNPSHWDYLHLVAKPTKISVRRYYFHYYKLLIKLFLRAKKDGVYDFIDYKDYVMSFINNIVKLKRGNDEQ